MTLTAAGQMDVPMYENIEQAAQRIAPYINRTPVFTSSWLNEQTGAALFFKCENLQKCGAFKARGATNFLFSLSDDELKNGVITNSSGNHGAAVAYAAKRRGTHATVVVPDNARAIKKAAVEHYGGKMVISKPGMQERLKTTEEILSKSGALYVPPFDHPLIVAGQGTCAREFTDQVDDLDMILTPVGGGGLLSGTALYTAEKHPRIQVIGAEPTGADDAYRSFQAGTLQPLNEVNTIADGLLAPLGEVPFAIIKEKVSAIELVTDEEIVATMCLVWQRMKLVIEPSSAVPLAAVLSGRVDVKNKRVGIVLSGGNVDFPTVM